MLNKLRFVALAGLLVGGLAHAADSLTIDVHRDANCGCCKDWILHLENNGFTVNDHVEPNMSSIKQAAGISQNDFLNVFFLHNKRLLSVYR